MVIVPTPPVSRSVVGARLRGPGGAGCGAGTGWASLPGTFTGGSGGGTSALFTQPSYQRGIVPAALSHADGTAAPMRVVPDIAADADFVTGPLIGASVSPSGQVGGYRQGPGGGTSVSGPLIAGMQADAQQAAGVPIGFANPAIYARYGTSAYHDVTDQPLGPSVTLDAVLPAGVNGSTAPQLVTFGLDRGLTSTPGYDDVTGVGTPAAKYFAPYATRPTSQQVLIGFSRRPGSRHGAGPSGHALAQTVA